MQSVGFTHRIYSLEVSFTSYSSFSILAYTFLNAAVLYRVGYTILLAIASC